MNLFTPTHLLVILLIILILFGRGKISEFMGDFAKGIKSFKKGLSEEEDEKRNARPAHLRQEEINSADAHEKQRESGKNS